MNYQDAEKQALLREWIYKDGAIQPKIPIVYDSPHTQYPMPYIVGYYTQAVGEHLVILHNTNLST